MGSFNPLDHPIVFTPPRRLTPFSVWHGHIPAAMLLVDLLRPEAFVELGTYYGDSFCAFCQAVGDLGLATRCYAVDTWEGDPQGGFYGPEVLADLREHHDALYGGFSRLIQSNFDEALSHFADGGVDLLHIDGYHTYDAVRHDFESWLPKMSTRGVIAFHDTNVREKDFGVWRLWDELKADRPHFEFGHSHGLGILGVGEELPPAIQPLLEASSQEAVRIRSLFFELGERIASQAQREGLTDRIEQRDSAIASLQAEAAERDKTIASLRAQVEAQAAEKKQAIASLQAHAAAMEEQAAVLELRMREQRLEVGHLRRGLGEQARAQHDLESRLAGRDRELAQIYSSLSWRLVDRYRRGVQGLLPQDSSRRRLYGRLVGGLKARRPGRRRRVSAEEHPGQQGPTPDAAVGANVGASAPDEGSRARSPWDASEVAPQVSVVVVARNGLDFTAACIRSIYDSIGRVSFEVIVVDNGSTDGVTAWLRAEASLRPSMTVIENPTNLGYARAVNQGAGVARGEYVAICNNDILVPDGWLDNLVRILDAHPELGVLSPVTNYVGEGPQLDAGAKDLTPETMGDYATARKLSGDPGPVWVPDRLVFFCVLVRGSLLAALGGLSEDYGLGNFEDDDFCIRTRMRGFLLAVDPMSFVFHHGSLTWTREGLSHPEWMRRNREVFYRKVAEYSTGLEEFSGHKAPGRAGASRRDAAEVSVIVRTLNRPHLLGQALASLANQTLDAFEVVVVNDAGCNVSHLVEKFSSRLNIKYVAHEVAQGRSASLNSGLSAATGRWIAYLDDDDIVYPLHLELLLGAVSVAEDPVAYALVHTVLSRHSEDGDILLARRPFALFEFSPDELLVQNRIPILSIMHSAECLERVGGFDESLHILEDWDFMIRLSQRFRFRQIEKVTSEYRFRIGDAIQNTIVSCREEAFRTHLRLYEKYPVHDPVLKRKRRDLIRTFREQVEEVRAIRESALPRARKALLIACRVLGIEPAEVQSLDGREEGAVEIAVEPAQELVVLQVPDGEGEPIRTGGRYPAGR